MRNSWLSTYLLTVQCQHRREVLAVGHACGIGHACFPQVGPESGCGDDRPIHRGHLPVVRGQSGRHQNPPWDAQEKGHNLRSHVSHFQKQIFPACGSQTASEPRASFLQSPPESRLPGTWPDHICASRSQCIVVLCGVRWVRACTLAVTPRRLQADPRAGRKFLIERIWKVFDLVGKWWMWDRCLGDIIILHMVHVAYSALPSLCDNTLLAGWRSTSTNSVRTCWGAQMICRLVVPLVVLHWHHLHFSPEKHMMLFRLFYHI